MFSATYNAVYINEILKRRPPRTLIPSIEDRTFWGNAPDAQGLLEAAHEASKKQLPVLTATMYLHYKRKGEREVFNRAREQRRGMLSALLLGECIEAEGRFLDPILNLVWAICEETTWNYPSYLPELPDVADPQIDLGASITGLALAELNAILGDRLDATVRDRIRYELERRLFTPYLTRLDWWLFDTPTFEANNWTSVCSGNIAGAALYLLDDHVRLSRILAQAIRSLDDFLKPFGTEGSSTEGVGYWGYGFGNYVIFADLLYRFTDGVIDLFDSPQVRAIAAFPLHTQLTTGHYVPFSDCDYRVKVPESLLILLAQHFDLPDLARLAAFQLPDADDDRDEQTWRVRDLLWRRDAPQADVPPVLNRRDWYPRIQWLISRTQPDHPDALVAAIKGGHNDEMHNQNDLGSLIVHRSGENLITDLGRGRYLKGYFGAERYTFFVNRSYGHGVPLVNGIEQATGRQFTAEVVDYAPGDDDRLTLALTDAYPPEADLHRLTRTLIVRRDEKPAVILEDSVHFVTEPGMLESALITLAQVTMNADHLILCGKQATVRVDFDPEQVAVLVEEQLGLELRYTVVDARRIAFRWHTPAMTGQIRLLIT